MVGLTFAPANAASTWRAPVASSDPQAWKKGQVKCADLLFIGARGSGETGRYGAEVHVIQQHMQQGMDANRSNAKVRQVWVDYPAAKVEVLADDLFHGRYAAAAGSNYFKGALKGYDSAARVLGASLRLCPKEKWVTAAYSQGALITDSLARNFDYPSRWAYNYTVGNTANYPNRNTLVGGSAFDNGRQPTGIYTWLYKTKAQVPSDLTSRTYTYCTAYDGMCDFSILKWIAAYNSKPQFPIHGGYAAGSELWGSSFEMGVEVAHFVGKQTPTRRPTATPTPTATTPPSGAVSDQALKGCLIAEYQTEFGQALTDISLPQISQLTQLDCRTGVASLTGLEYATSLRDLYVSPTTASDLSPLAGLTALKTLDISSNEIETANLTDLSPLRNLTGLESLQLWGTFTNLAPLSNLTSLTNLYLNGKYTDLSPLSTLTELRHLSLFGYFADVSPLAGMTNLTGVWGNVIISYNPQMTDFTPLANLPAGVLNVEVQTSQSATTNTPILLPQIKAPDGAVMPWYINNQPAEPQGTITSNVLTWQTSGSRYHGTLVDANATGPYGGAAARITFTVSDQ